MSYKNLFRASCVLALVLTAGSFAQATLITTATDTDASDPQAFASTVLNNDLVNSDQAATLSSMTVVGYNTQNGGPAGYVNDGIHNTGWDSLYDLSSSDTTITVTFALNTAVNSLGYDLTQIRSYTSWDAGWRVSQRYGVSVEYANNLGTWVSLAPVDFSQTGNLSAVRVTLENDVNSGVTPFATGVSGVRFTIDNSSNGNNTFQSVWREFDVVGTATTDVPEPGTLVLLGAGMISLLCYAWRKRK